MIRRAIVAACLAMAAATPAAAQDPPASQPRTLEFLSRVDFHLSAAGLAEDDDRFSWDARVGGEFDLVDYIVGRMTVLAEYQAVLGNQLQLFDPNQGNYNLAAASSGRLGRNEMAIFFHHLSRHLSDRAKTFGITVNDLGWQFTRPFRTGDTSLELRADVGKVLHVVYLDYTWLANAEIVVRRPLNPRVALFSRARGELYGIDPDIAGRDDQQGGHVEGGVRLTGGAGAVEFFGGFEKVVDADPIARQARQWAFAGIRIVDH